MNNLPALNAVCLLCRCSLLCDSLFISDRVEAVGDDATERAMLSISCYDTICFAALWISKDE